MLYNDKNNNIQTALYGKPTDQPESEHKYINQNTQDL